MVNFGLRVAVALHMRSMRQAVRHAASRNANGAPGSPNAASSNTDTVQDRNCFDEAAYRSELQYRSREDSRYLYALLYCSKMSRMMQPWLVTVL